MEIFDETKYTTKKELFEFLVQNKERLITQKRAEMKRADGFAYSPKRTETKAVEGNPDQIHVKAIINTTNFMDSHNDVHMPGIWVKSLKENQMIMHLQEHQLQFDKIIADGEDLKAYTQELTWKELGYPYEGKTEALIFDSIVRKERNEFMLKQYMKGNVKNHSVGMVYVKLLLAVNDEEYGAEKEAWDKYYPQIANKERADERGYFWAVKEAKVIEGSAVPIGSNTATPTLITEAAKSTPVEPSKDTQTKQIYLLNLL